MKTLVFGAVFIFLFTSFASAQAGPPPPPAPAPDYNPRFWKEYSFRDDNVRFRFPVEPKREDTVSGTEKHPAHTYTRQSFLLLQLTVTTWPVDHDVEAQGILTRAIREGALGRIAKFEPKIVQEEDVKVDGHPAKFLKVETNNGMVVRMKVFAVKNRLYIAYAMVEKGERHGFNWENDFEVPTMAFLDSIHLID